MKTAVRSHNRPMHGFTVVELMITIAVVAILTAIAVPNLRTYVLNSRRDSVLDGLVASLHYARTEAIDLNQATYLCAGITGATTDTPPCATDVWSNGWQVVTNPANGGAAKLLSTHALNTSSTAPTLTAVNGSVYFQFNGNGTVTIPSGAATEMIRVCDARGATFARAVEINTAGFIQPSSQPGQDPTGTAITTCP
ncbi:GspH/FimT family pseudopilin [Rhodanobacter sp. Si-c]|uniref:Type II secretion system protein H n=1 Tax=Rhodanobacter lycopersici TaxID=3162487 RepID=A0ABV3QGZ9_9GAMM